MTEPVSVLFVAPDLSMGGLQRHLIRLANALSASGHRVSVVTYEAGDALAGELDANIQRFRLSGRSSSPALWLRLRNLLGKTRPDIAVGWSIYPSLILSLLKLTGLRSSVVATELNYPPLAYGFGNAGNRLEQICRIVLPRADMVTANSAETTAYMKSFAGPKAQVARIFNPVALSPLGREVSRVGAWWDAPQRVLAVGRLLNRHKGFDLLVDAMTKVTDRNPEARLLIVGDGPDRQVLLDRIGELRLGEVVTVLAGTPDVQEYYARATTFVLPSRYEGFPNVLVEAMQAETVVVAANCKTGPSELIVDGETGFLCAAGDGDALADAINRALALSDAQRDEMAARAVEMGRSFRPELAAARYEGDVIAPLRRYAEARR